jgi:transposase
MKTTKTAHKRKTTTEAAVLYMALELSFNIWKLAFSIGERIRIVSVAGGDLMALHEAIKRAKDRFKLEGPVRVISCYEAGRDGFWLHRYLKSSGIENLVVDSSSIEVDRRSRRAKTDRLDARKLVEQLMRYHKGEKKCFRVVRVPSVEDEDARRLHRELERLKKEQTGHRNRIRSLLLLHGIRLEGCPWNKVGGWIEEVRLYNGSPLPEGIRSELLREVSRYELVHAQVLSLERTQEQAMGEGKTRGAQVASQLRTIWGIGLQGSWLLSHEAFAWRHFGNRREVGSFPGLTGVPHDSGETRREQGISKAGNHRVRSMLNQLAWGWLRFQPQSELSRWFNERYGHASKRMRRVGIVAVSRKLLILLWRYVKYGTLPEDVLVKVP